MATDEIPDLDPNIRALVAVLNSFETIHTTGSCGGHADPGPGQDPQDVWSVTFDVDHSEEGWVALEWLVWLINNDYRRGGHDVFLGPYAPPPYLNTPGQCLSFHLGGHKENPDTLAEWIAEQKVECYYTPAEWAAAAAAEAADAD
jgi:hypothetical protein